VRRITPPALAALVALAWAGCASSGGSADEGSAGGGPGEVTLTRVGEAVQMTDNAEITQDCEFITDLDLPGGQSTRDANAMRALRNQAGSRGANLVLLVMETRTTIERAEGYLCAD